MIEAAKEGDAERVAELIESGENMDLPDRDGIPAIMWAIMKGHVDVAVLLLENGAALKTGSNFDEVRIILGMVKDPRRAAELLVKRRPYVLAGENYGSILLINALRYSRKDVALALMEKDLNFELPDDSGVTPLAYAIIFAATRNWEGVFITAVRTFMSPEWARTKPSGWPGTRETMR